MNLMKLFIVLYIGMVWGVVINLKNISLAVQLNSTGLGSTQENAMA